MGMMDGAFSSGTATAAAFVPEDSAFSDSAILFWELPELSGFSSGVRAVQPVKSSAAVRARAAARIKVFRFMGKSPPV